MRKSLWNPDSRRELVARLGRLTPETRPKWGRMTAPQMLAHLVDWMRMANGELQTAVWHRRTLRYTPLKQLLIYWVPIPKGVPTAPELIKRAVTDWTGECAAMCRYIDSYETRDATRAWPEHPAFGDITTSAWGVLGYRHTDHHLRQFGV